MGIILKEGFDFGFKPDACGTCSGKCCIGEPGRIWINQQEILKISSLLQINPVDYIHTYLLHIGNRFSIKERFTEEGLECVFFDRSNNQCSIYKARPSQCRKYPFWEHYRDDMEQVIRDCPGIVELEDKGSRIRGFSAPADSLRRKGFEWTK